MSRTRCWWCWWCCAPFSEAVFYVSLHSAAVARVTHEIVVAHSRGAQLCLVAKPHLHVPAVRAVPPIFIFCELRLQKPKQSSGKRLRLEARARARRARANVVGAHAPRRARGHACGHPTVATCPLVYLWAKHSWVHQAVPRPDGHARNKVPVATRARLSVEVFGQFEISQVACDVRRHKRGGGGRHGARTVGDSGAGARP